MKKAKTVRISEQTAVVVSPNKDKQKRKKVKVWERLTKLNKIRHQKEDELKGIKRALMKETLMEGIYTKDVQEQRRKKAEQDAVDKSSKAWDVEENSTSSWKTWKKINLFANGGFEIDKMILREGQHSMPVEGVNRSAFNSGGSSSDEDEWDASKKSSKKSSGKMSSKRSQEDPMDR